MSTRPQCIKYNLSIYGVPYIAYTDYNNVTATTRKYKVLTQKRTQYHEYASASGLGRRAAVAKNDQPLI